MFVPQLKIPFAPTKAMLYEGDTSLLLLNDQTPNKIFKMDLTKEEVVEEYNTDKFSAIDLLPENKFAQQQGVKTFLALNRAGVFAIDPRAKRFSHVLQNRTFQYTNTKNANISCGAPTEKGHIVMGTTAGEIRLFSASSLKGTHDGEGKPRAINTLPGLGDPIIAIDVTRDGKWVLATCKDYLIVIPTTVENSTGFDVPFGRRKPAPFRLALNNKDTARAGGEINFTPAHFNYAIDGTESKICTSTGNWLISWNFKQVTRTVGAPYSMIEYKEDVMAEDFMGSSDNAIVVALPDDVTLARTKLNK